MNVKELIEKLSTYDPETMVIVYGYEGGVNEAEYAGDVKIKLKVMPHQVTRLVNGN